MAIQDVIERIADDIEAISGIKGASDYLPEQLPDVENWVVIYPGEAEFIGGNPAEYMTALYNVEVEIHTPKTTLPEAIQRIVDYYDAIPLALFDDLFDTQLNSTVSTFGNITSTGLVAMEYAGIKTIGFRYTVRDVKIQQAVT